jgi:hypothetical protein
MAPPFAKPLLALCITAAVAACTSTEGPNPGIGDGGFLSGTPCRAPCFFGIEPGSATLSEAEEDLAKAAICPNPKSFDTAPEGGTRGFHCGGWITVSAGSEEDRVTTLGFSPSEQMTLQDVVDALGPPDGVVTVRTGSPEAQRSVMMLFYDRMLTRLLLPEQEAPAYMLDPAIAVERVVYFDQDAFEGVRHPSAPWAGFVEYKAAD